MRISLVIGLAALVAFASASFAQDKSSQKFLKEAIEGNLAEVQMGLLRSIRAGKTAHRLGPR
jgi:hypothetical protein